MHGTIMFANSKQFESMFANMHMRTCWCPHARVADIGRGVGEEFDLGLDLGLLLLAQLLLALLGVQVVLEPAQGVLLLVETVVFVLVRQLFRVFLVDQDRLGVPGAPCGCVGTLGLRPGSLLDLAGLFGFANSK